MTEEKLRIRNPVMTRSRATSDQRGEAWPPVANPGDARYGVRSSAPTDGEFGEHQWQDDQCEAGDVQHHESATAIGANFIGKFPNAPESDRVGDICKNETDPPGPEVLFVGHGTLAIRLQFFLPGNVTPGCENSYLVN